MASATGTNIVDLGELIDNFRQISRKRVILLAEALGADIGKAFGPCSSLSNNAGNPQIFWKTQASWLFKGKSTSIPDNPS